MSNPVSRKSSRAAPKLQELVDVKILQELQNWFAETTGITAAIRDTEGFLITRSSTAGSRFCKYIMSTETGCQRCRLSNRSAYLKATSAGAKADIEKPVKYVCHTGLTQFAVPIKVGGYCVATLVVGDRPTVPLTHEQVDRLAHDLHLDARKLRKYAAEMKPWSEREMRRAIQFLHSVAGAITEMSYQSYQLRRRVRELTSLHAISRLLTSTLDLQEILNIIAEHITKSVGMHACSIRLLEPGGRQLVIRSYYNLSRRYVDKGPVVVARSVIDQQVINGRVVKITDMTNDPRVLYPNEAAEEGLRAGLAVPLITKEGVIGALHLYSAEPHRFSDEEIRTIRALANLAATAIENARLYKASIEKQALDRELLVAREIQGRLLPRSYPTLPGFDIAAVSHPCRQVGGDFYDFIPIEDDHCAFVIADVAGKGVPGAILMASARAALRAQVESAPGARPSRVCARLNRVLYRDTSSNQFVSLFYGVLNLKDKSLVYTNAGHNRPFCLNSGITWLDRGGVVLGAVPDENYAQGRLVLKKGDAVVFYTDGITDAMNEKGDSFGEQRLLQTVAGNKKRPAAEILQAIMEDVESFARGAPATDDRTLLILKVK